MRLISARVISLLACAATGGLFGFAWAPETRASAAPTVGSRDLVVIDAGEQDRLIAHDMPVTFKGASFFLAEWDSAQQELARSRSIRFKVIQRRIGADQELFLFELHEDEQPPPEWTPHTLFRQGVKIIVAMDGPTAESWTETGHHGVRIGRRSRGWETAAPSLIDCSVHPVVQDLLGRMDSSRWFDWIEKISGIEPVEVGGVSAPIASRHSTRLFSGHAHARGFDFLQQQVQSWHYGPGPATVEIDPFSAADLALVCGTCTAFEGATWKNLVLTIPGQGSPGELVLATAHFDSRAATTPPGQVLAPGADDNGTGSGLLLEAARLLRQFRFQRTIKIIWFTGEEQLLLGSAAYVRDHPLGSITGVMNMDMAGYDSNGDRCFEIHVGTLAQSDAVGQCFAASADQYSPTLNYDYLTTNATDRSDHASFWNATPSVGAIEISENFFSDSSPGGCTGVDMNPNYHTTADTIAGVAQSFGFEVARVAMATVAAMAGPVQACFADAPVLAANAGVSAVDLSWSAVPGASAYRIYRSKLGCQGQWAELGETAATSWTDAQAIDPTTYSYTIEAVGSDGFCVSRQSNCVSAQPTVYRARATGAVPADLCAAGGPGSGNGILDPGETVTLPVSLLNNGNTTLTSIAGTISSPAPGLSATDASASWPNLAPTASALSLPDHFTVALDDGAACGPRIDLDLALGYAQGGNLSGLSLFTGGTAPVSLLDQSFAGGIPAGWTLVNGGGGGGSAATWTTANPGARAIGSPFAAPFAIVDSSFAGSGATQDEQLVTPAVDASSCRQVNLTFSNQFNYDSGAPYEFADVDVSTDGGTNWTTVLRMLPEDNGFSTPNTRTIDITSTIAPDPSNVRARFHFHQAQNDLWWAIDNVKIECAQPVCDVCLAPPGAPGEAGVTAPLLVRRESGNLVFDWGAPAAGCGAVQYVVYRGDLATLQATGYNHDTALGCGQPSSTFSIPETDPRLGQADYYLVVAGSGSAEGSYGRDTSGNERPVSAAACLSTQDLGSCGP